jgi:hypothetical protein
MAGRGRPRVIENGVRVEFSIPRAAYVKALDLSKVSGVSVAALLRDAVERGLHLQPTGVPTKAPRKERV